MHWLTSASTQYLKTMVHWSSTCSWMNSTLLKVGRLYHARASPSLRWRIMQSGGRQYSSSCSSFSLLLMNTIQVVLCMYLFVWSFECICGCTFPYFCRGVLALLYPALPVPRDFAFLKLSKYSSTFTTQISVLVSCRICSRDFGDLCSWEVQFQWWLCTRSSWPGFLMVFLSISKRIPGY